jgi:hypothetical protein
MAERIELQFEELRQPGGRQVPEGLDIPGERAVEEKR